jgi:hypothetical protein
MKANLIIGVKMVSLLKKIVTRTWWLPLTWGSLSNCAWRARLLDTCTFIFVHSPQIDTLLDK